MKFSSGRIYDTPSNGSMKVDQISTITAGITCSQNVAYSAVSSKNTIGNDYLVPMDASGSITYLAAKGLTGQKKEQYEADIYEEVQDKTTSY